MSTQPRNIKIGTLLEAAAAEKLIPQMLPYGFESFSITFWQTLGDINLAQLGKKVVELCSDQAEISCLSFYGNPLSDDKNGEIARQGLEAVIDNARHFNTKLISGFAGRVPDVPVPASIPRFKEVWGPLAKRAADQGCCLAFENCSMGGSWHSGDSNIAFNPKAWELMFDALPDSNLGLEWEPCHQLVQLIDPLPQLRKWIKKIFHVHGKDATIAWDIIREHGILGGVRGRPGGHTFSWHRTPGFGDSNWTDIISILKQNDYQGTIDIEGYHDPVYRGEWEMTGQVHALNYLKQCRGGDFIPKPEGLR